MNKENEASVGKPIVRNLLHGHVNFLLADVVLDMKFRRPVRRQQWQKSDPFSGVFEQEDVGLADFAPVAVGECQAAIQTYFLGLRTVREFVQGY